MRKELDVGCFMHAPHTTDSFDETYLEELARKAQKLAKEKLGDAKQKVQDGLKKNGPTAMNAAGVAFPALKGASLLYRFCQCCC